MRMLERVVLILTVLLLMPPTLMAAPPQVHRYELNNGVQLIALHIPDSRNAGIFSYVPLGLVHDGPGQAQWSHVVEHLVIRSTMPESLQAGNAETMPDHMRLDFYGTVDNWRHGLEHHAKWIEGVPFNQTTLEREKPKVLAECDYTAKQFATHKFAIAAWAQGYRHDRRHAALKADVQRAALTDVQAYRDRRFAILNKVLICVVGGLEPELVKTAVENRFTVLKNSADSVRSVEIHHANRDMIWDLEARHLLMVWSIPDVAHRDYPALMVTAQNLMMRFFADADLKKHTGMVLAGADLMTPEGTFFYISASLRPDAGFDRVRQHVVRHLETLKTQPDNLAMSGFVARQLAQQLTAPMDPAAVRGQLPPGVSPKMLEMNIGLQWGTMEYRFGARLQKLAERMAAVNARECRTVMDKHLTVGQAATFTIHP